MPIQHAKKIDSRLNVRQPGTFDFQHAGFTVTLTPTTGAAKFEASAAHPSGETKTETIKDWAGARLFLNTLQAARAA